MLSTVAAENSKIDKITREWKTLSQADRELLIAVLLDSIVGWRAWSSTDLSRLNWLEKQFNKAGIPFRLTD
jgi:hypothetical protein